MKTISAIILNHNNYSDLKNGLQSLQAQSLPADYKLKIIIIDNGSADDSTRRLRREFPQPNFIFNHENLGFAAGVNQGLKISLAASDYFLLLNNDASLEPTGLSKLLAVMDDSVALAGPTIFYRQDPALIWQAGGYFRLSKMGVSVPLKNKTRPGGETPQTVDFLSGCVLLINKTALKTLGFLDEKFFFYGEDLDLGLRAKQTGYRVIYVPLASAWHKIAPGGASRSSAWALNNLAKSYFLIIRKHFPALLTYGVFLFVFIYTPLRLYQIIKGRNRMKNILAWFSGGFSGLNTKLKS